MNELERHDQPLLTEPAADTDVELGGYGDPAGAPEAAADVALLADADDYPVETDSDEGYEGDVPEGGEFRSDRERTAPYQRTDEDGVGGTWDNIPVAVDARGPTDVPPIVPGSGSGESDEPEPNIERGTSQIISVQDGPEEVEVGPGDRSVNSDSVGLARSDEDTSVSLSADVAENQLITFHRPDDGQAALANVGHDSTFVTSEQLLDRIREAAPALGRAGVNINIVGSQEPGIGMIASKDVPSPGDELRSWLKTELPQIRNILLHNVVEGAEVVLDTTNGTITVDGVPIQSE